MTTAESVRLARDLLLGEAALQGGEQAALTIATAQAWATVAVAEAIGRLAGAVEAMHGQ